MDKTKGCILSHATQIIEPGKGQVYLCDFKSERFDIGAYKALQYLQIQNSRENISVIPPSVALEMTKHKELLQFTHLVVASQVDLVELIELVEGNLLPGAQIVIYSRFMTCLERLANHLFRKNNYININIVDTHFRQLQVLSLRSHPLMSGNLYGGFILTACYVVN